MYQTDVKLLFRWGQRVRHELTVLPSHMRPQAWARGAGGHLPSPEKVEKYYHVKKNFISAVSLNGLDAIGLLGVCLGLGSQG